MSPSHPVVHADAPGRVNLIGEHTDYNGGFVLPTAIPQRTHAQLRVRNDNRVTARSKNASPPGEYIVGEEEQQRNWLDYVQGITWALRAAGFQIMAGFDLKISSEVPLGAGLSSSASLEVALLRGLRDAFQLDLDDVMLAKIGQTAENDFVGARCGIMDQMAANLADQGTALFLDTRSLEYRRVPLPSTADLVVIDSGVRHAIAGGDYNTRRAECETAARLLKVRELRDVTTNDLERIDALAEPLSRRARHVVTEDERVLQAVDALEAADPKRLGALFVESHWSQARDFEVSTPEVDLLVELALEQRAVYGARLTGGGFGGAVVILTHSGAGAEVGNHVAGQYAERSKQTPKLLVPQG
ncbi:MAG: galactokinase [Chloroflexi bacterium]|nr:galactokinase [Chloroflexota bacterium]MBV9547946.1 galactokinase [Chloroflexota bacterium]